LIEEECQDEDIDEEIDEVLLGTVTAALKKGDTFYD
jgi:hypothetical protein